MPMVTTRMREAVRITMPSAVRMKRTLLLQNVSNEKARISPTAIFDRIGIWVATLLICPYRCYVGGRRLARELGRKGARLLDALSRLGWYRPRNGERAALEGRGELAGV